MPTEEMEKKLGKEAAILSTKNFFTENKNDPGLNLVKVQELTNNPPGFEVKRFYCDVYMGDCSSEIQIDSAADVSIIAKIFL